MLRAQPIVSVQPWFKWLGWAIPTGVATLLTGMTPLGAAELAPQSARVIVKFKEAIVDKSLQSATDGSTLKRAQQVQTEQAVVSARLNIMGQRMGLNLVPGKMIGQHAHVVQGVGLSSQMLAYKLSQDPTVEYAVVDERRHIQRIPNDPAYAPQANWQTNMVPAGQWYLKPANATTPASINAQDAWDNSSGSPTGVIVAVIDTGVLYEHPDLKRVDQGGKLLTGANMVSTAGAGNGRSLDASDPGDATTDNQCGAGILGQASSWHGTAVASLIGAKSDNHEGMASVGWDTRVLPVRALGPCGGYDSDILAAMNWAVGDTVSGVTQLDPQLASQVKVINLSLGEAGACTQAYKDVIANLRQRGVLVVASAGNLNGKAVGVPANCPGVLAVGGLRHTGTKVAYSAVGSEISLSAPGGNCINSRSNCLYPVLAATNTGTQAPNTGANDYTYANTVEPPVGTSLSAPLVSGAAALMFHIRPDLQPSDIQRLLKDTARAFPVVGGLTECHAPDNNNQDECNCTKTTCGAGMLDVASAVSAAKNGIVPRIQINPSTPHVGQTLTLNAAISLPSVTASQIVSYNWVLVDTGGTVSRINGPATAASIQLDPQSSGAFTVEVTVTDDKANQATTRETVFVAPAETPPSNGGGGGGGGMSNYVLLFLAAVVAGLAHKQRQR